MHETLLRTVANMSTHPSYVYAGSQPLFPTRSWKTSRGEKALKRRVATAVYLIAVVVLITGGARPVAADQSTRIYNFTAYETGGVVNMRRATVS